MTIESNKGSDGFLNNGFWAFNEQSLLEQCKCVSLKGILDKGKRNFSDCSLHNFIVSCRHPMIIIKGLHSLKLCGFERNHWWRYKYVWRSFRLQLSSFYEFPLISKNLFLWTYRVLFFFLRNRRGPHKIKINWQGWN